MPSVSLVRILLTNWTQPAYTFAFSARGAVLSGNGRGSPDTPSSPAAPLADTEEKLPRTSSPDSVFDGGSGASMANGFLRSIDRKPRRLARVAQFWSGPLPSGSVAALRLPSDYANGSKILQT